MVGTQQAAHAAAERDQCGHGVLKEPSPVVAALGQGIGQPIYTVRQCQQRHRQQRHTGSCKYQRQPRLFAFGLDGRRFSGAVIHGRAGGAVVHGGVLAVHFGLDRVGFLLKPAQLAVFDGSIDGDKRQPYRPSAQHKGSHNAPPRELKRRIAAVVFARGRVAVLVAGIAAAVGLLGVGITGLAGVTRVLIRHNVSSILTVYRLKVVLHPR